MADAQEVFVRVREIAQGACLMTRAKVEIRDESGTYETLPNLVLGGVVHGHLRRVGPPAFDKADFDFARALRKTVGLDPTGPDRTQLDNRVSEISSAIVMGSTDVGDVSWTVPTAEFSIAARAVGAPTHSWPFVATAGSPVGHKCCTTAARVMAGAALELMQSPAVLKAARDEFRRRTEGFKYVCGIPVGAAPPEKIDD
jgi:aminobenzoyl-glutamate utilization protein B